MKKIPVKIPRSTKALKEKIENFYSYDEVFDIENAKELLKEINSRPEKKEPSYYGGRESSMEDFEEILTFLNFSKVHEVSNQWKEEKRYHDKDEPLPRDIKSQIWAHSSGVLLQIGGSKYSWSRKSGTAVGNFLCHTEVDTGNAYGLISPLRSRSFGACSSSGDSMPSGSWVRSSSLYQHSVYEFLNYLDNCQQLGRLLPFKDWKKGEYILTIRSRDIFDQNENEYVSVDNLFHDEDHRKRDEKKDKKEFKVIQKKVEQMVKNQSFQAFPGLGDILISCSRDFEARKNARTKSDKFFDWRLCELALQAYDDLCYFSLARFPNADDKEKLTRWFEYCSSSDESGLLPSDWTSSVVGGFTLMHALLAQTAQRNLHMDRYTRASPPGAIFAGDLFIEKLKSLPFETLFSLCTEEDASKKNFLLHMYSARTSARFFSGINEREITRVWDDAISVIKERFEKENKPLPSFTSSQTSALGIWFQGFEQRNSFSLSHSSSLSEAYDILNSLERLGFGVSRSWNISLPCRYDHDKQSYRYEGLLVDKPLSIRAENHSDFLAQRPLKNEKELKDFMEEVINANPAVQNVNADRRVSKRAM